MTEEEWHRADDPQELLEQLPKQTSRRKLRLFAVACCRRVLHLLPDDQRFLSALTVAEQYADRKAGKKELTTARERAQAAKGKDRGTVGYRPQGNTCGDTARWAAEAVVCDVCELPNTTYPFRAAAMAITAAVYSALVKRRSPGTEPGIPLSIAAKAELSSLGGRGGLAWPGGSELPCRVPPEYRDKGSPPGSCMSAKASRTVMRTGTGSDPRA